MSANPAGRELARRRSPRSGSVRTWIASSTRIRLRVADAPDGRGLLDTSVVIELATGDPVTRRSDSGAY
jgi:hypothetical protein